MAACSRIASLSLAKMKREHPAEDFSHARQNANMVIVAKNDISQDCIRRFSSVVLGNIRSPPLQQPPIEALLHPNTQFAVGRALACSWETPCVFRRRVEMM
ncbi:hypothetical protein [Sinorhizobium fredii]|uniref:hypothetical protein n=1 Tax=Rhizobium fredii TaxID=380 RepID=UPI0012FD3075|nr:hypothetical protein [Sinorhizobium fredii]